MALSDQPQHASDPNAWLGALVDVFGLLAPTLGVTLICLLIVGACFRFIRSSQYNQQSFQQDQTELIKSVHKSNTEHLDQVCDVLEKQTRTTIDAIERVQVNSLFSPEPGSYVDNERESSQELYEKIEALSALNREQEVQLDSFRGELSSVRKELESLKGNSKI